MSQENVAVVGDYLSSFVDGGVEAMVEFMDEDVDWRAIEGAPDDVGEMHGREAMRRYFQDWVDMFDDITNVPEEILDLGDDRVLAVQHVTGRAKGSGIETELRYAVVYTLRDGRIVRAREYLDRVVENRTRDEKLDDVEQSARCRD